MFCGIIEETGKVVSLRKEGSNLHIGIACSFAKETKINQSIASDGVCLTVVSKNASSYTVTAIKETLEKTSLGKLKKGSLLNLERCMKLRDRIDGHMVQGHVDGTAVCSSVKEENGSRVFRFEFGKNCPDNSKYLVVPKGSIAVNGVSLTVTECNEHGFSVAIIPYTFDHTNFSTLRKGSTVNLEFDVLGKYVFKTTKY